MERAFKMKQKAFFISQIICSIKIVTVTTIFIRGDMENIQIRGTFLCDIYPICADYNRWLSNYKITQFTVFVRGGWEVDEKF